jgi:hypothetical protein
MVIKSIKNNNKNNSEDKIYEYNNNINENYIKDDYYETHYNANNIFDIKSLIRM